MNAKWKSNKFYSYIGFYDFTLTPNLLNNNNLSYELFSIFFLVCLYFAGVSKPKTTKTTWHQLPFQMQKSIGNFKKYYKCCMTNAI